MALAMRGHRHLVLKGFDDAPMQFRAYLESLPADALADILLTRLGPALARLPIAVARAVEELFRTPDTITTVEDLARLAGVRHRRRLHEALDRAGWLSGWVLLRAARVVRAYHYLSQGPPGATRVRDVAAKLGYATARGLANEVRAVSGFLPSSLATQLEPHDFLARVAAGLVRTDIAVPLPVAGTPADQHVPRGSEGIGA